MHNQEKVIFLGVPSPPSGIGWREKDNDIFFWNNATQQKPACKYVIILLTATGTCFSQRAIKFVV